MININKFIELAKKVVIKPPFGIENKIIKRISESKESDKLLINDEFLDYLKRQNSRLYFLSEKVKNNPGKIIAISAAILVLIFLIIEFINYKNSLSSSKNST